MALFLEHFEPTEEGKKLVEDVEADALNKFRMVYKYNEEVDGYVFKTIWNSEDENEDDDIVLPLHSTFVDMLPVPKGTKFVNAIGCSKDTYRGPDYIGTWINVLLRKYIPYHKYSAMHCCTDHKYYRFENGEEREVKKEGCKQGTVGSHVILNETVSREINVLTDKYVHILPICYLHRIAKVDAKNFGTGYYMKTGVDSLAMRMENYVPKEKVNSYLDKYGPENIMRI